jgi:heme-degrading monooxygenase HmoA
VERRSGVGERDNVYTFGSWLVKPGKEGDFILAWETFARWTGEHQPGMEGEARLLQDIDETRHFISIGRWSEVRRVRAWHESPEFLEFFAKVSDLCEETRPHMLKPVVEVAQKKR